MAAGKRSVIEWDTIVESRRKPGRTTNSYSGNSEMPIGIKPIVDFAFKKIFGSPENTVALMGLLNAILDLDEPIIGVEILNPFS